MYTLDDELIWWHEKFKEDAFFDDRGRLVFQSKILLNQDLAWCLIVNHNGFKHEWWRNYIGLAFLAKLVFHKRPGTEINFLYEVMPVYAFSDRTTVHGKRIKADCVYLLSEATHVPVPP